MADPRPESPPNSRKLFLRFDVIQRLEHALLLLSFTTLAVTGLVQKFSTLGASEWFIGILGGIENTRLVHRAAAIVLGSLSVYHILDVAYRILVLRTPLTMLPVIEDFKHLYQDVMFYLGRRPRRARYGRYSYAEKVEYLAVVWGTLIMGLTGFMMWNPLASARWFHGQAIPAAKAAHGGEAILAVLAIFVWHFYHVHLRHFNKSIFTGRLTEEEMHEEHPAELADLERAPVPLPPPAILRRRQQIFLPVALVFAGLAAFGLYKFVTLETTAVVAAPPAETAPIYVPQTPTPTLPPPPTPTAAATSAPAPAEATAGPTGWNTGISSLLAERCSACHGPSALGQLVLTSYALALQGGVSGPAIVPGDPDASLLLQVQSTGTHPGQLTSGELSLIAAWINAGAPEN